MKNTTFVFFMILFVAPSAMGQSATFGLIPDVPTQLPAGFRLPWEIVEHDATAGTYTATTTLPVNTFVTALHEMDSGDRLFAVDAPTNLGGTVFEPRDVIRFDGAVYSLFFDGAANGVPAGTSVDAVFLLGGDTGDPVLSFDVPTSVGGTWYLAGDLVRFTGAVASLHFDAAAAGLPAGTNVIGADESAAGVALTFDVPTKLGGTFYLPGQLVEWDGASFSLLYGDPVWPISSQFNGFCLQGGEVLIPGAVSATLMADKVSASTVHLSWAASCGAAAADYGIYEGQIGDWTSHTMVDCIDDGADLSENVNPAAGSRYFLVVPHDAVAVEGSYGTDHSGAERPPGTATCQAARSLGQCS